MITLDMNLTVDNSVDKVAFRQKMLTVEEGMKQRVSDKISVQADCPLTHYFTPKDDKYGCHVYAREILLPKGSVVIGKIHRHQHLNIISKGKVTVFTEFGKKELTAPCTFVSEVGLKRAVYSHEDTIWTTIHLTEHMGEDNLNKIEDEVIAPTYSDLNLLSSLKELEALENTGETL